VLQELRAVGPGMVDRRLGAKRQEVLEMEAARPACVSSSVLQELRPVGPGIVDRRFGAKRQEVLDGSCETGLRVEQRVAGA